MDLENCKLCPRNCGINRMKTQGFCKAPPSIKIARAALHFDEEPPIKGKGGSGAIFFSCCNLRCLYCQNEKISLQNFGKEISVDRLVEIFFELEQQGAENINLVSPTPYLPWIKEAILKAKRQGFSLPFVYNTSGYENKEILKELEGLIDIYLPDFKYACNETAFEYSLCKDYVERTKEALQEMVQQTGPNQFDENGRMIKGVLVRHLVLPFHEKESKEILFYLYHTYHHQIYLSIMNQYTPLDSTKTHPVLSQTLSKKAYEDVLEYALRLGIENAFIQEEGTAEEAWIPSFCLEGVNKES